jgi:hypothetical protein
MTWIQLIQGLMMAYCHQAGLMEGLEVGLMGGLVAEEEADPHHALPYFLTIQWNLDMEQ